MTQQWPVRVLTCRSPHPSKFAQTADSATRSSCSQGDVREINRPDRHAIKIGACKIKPELQHIITLHPTAYLLPQLRFRVSFACLYFPLSCVWTCRRVLSTPCASDAGGKGKTQRVFHRHVDRLDSCRRHQH